MNTRTALDTDHALSNFAEAADLVGDTAIYLHGRAPRETNGEELVPFATAYLAAAILVGFRYTT